MKHLVMALLMVAAVARAGRDGSRPDWLVTVCLNPSAHPSDFYLAKGIAFKILLDAGVRLDWQGSGCRCAQQTRTIQIRVSEATPPAEHPGALGAAYPYEGTQIVVFYDRVWSNCRPSEVSTMLGHVMAHEIVHVLQGIACHSPEGLMKAEWTGRDHVAMRLGKLRLSDWDITLIHAGLEKPWHGPTQ